MHTIEATRQYDAVHFSRNATSNPLGKLTAEIGKIHVPECVRDGLQERATRLHMSLSEYVREVLTLHVFGREHIERLHAERLDVLGANLTDEGKE